MRAILLTSLTLALGFTSQRLCAEDKAAEAAAAPAKTPDNFATSPDQHGLGFGPIIMGTEGLAIYYDYNLHGMNKQLHLQLDAGHEVRRNLLGDPIVKLTQTNISITARHVFTRGWYLGAGLGRYNTTLQVSQDAEGSKPAQELEFYKMGALGLVEAGWQGNDFYYFHIGVRPALIIYYTEVYNVNRVYDVSNHRATTEELWEDGQNYSSLILGFGWYLEP